VGEGDGIWFERAELSLGKTIKRTQQTDEKQIRIDADFAFCQTLFARVCGLAYCKTIAPGRIAFSDRSFSGRASFQLMSLL
jgi:hypothetical protein